MGDRFKMSDLGELKWFFGTEYKRSKNSIKMNQIRYSQKILSKFKISDCKQKPTPSVLGIENLSNIKSPKLSDPRINRGIVGSLIYVMTGTRPDLCYIVTKLSQKMSTVAYLGTAKDVLLCLKGTQDLG